MGPIIRFVFTACHYTPRRRLGERRYSSYSLTTSALDRGEWSASCSGHTLPPGKGPPVPIGQEAGWAPEPVWTQRLEENSIASAGDRTPVGTVLTAFSGVVSICCLCVGYLNNMYEECNGVYSCMRGYPYGSVWWTRTCKGRSNLDPEFASFHLETNAKID